jgi:uroporphyrinogen decarboxylase
LQKVLQTTASLKKQSGGEVPIIGVAMSPFSLPVMQMGFDKYFELIYFHREKFHRLMRLNEAFCNEWANAQLEAGATAICYFDPLASPSMIPRDIFLETGYHVAQRTIASIRGPVVLHLASTQSMPILSDLVKTGISAVAVCAEENLSQIKAECKNKMAVLGNLNGIAMRRWTKDETFFQVKNAIAAGAKDGGFILSDHHGEIPWQVPQEVLYWVAEAVREYGTYPLKWVDGNGR